MVITTMAGGLSCLAVFLISWKVWKTAYTKPRDRGIDPIAEAEVFLSYGRTKAAVRVLRDLLAEEPDNIAAKVTLLRVYLANRDIQAYCQLAAHLKSKLQHQSVWKTIQNKGRELDPNNSLFTL